MIPEGRARLSPARGWNLLTWIALSGLMWGPAKGSAFPYDVDSRERPPGVEAPDPRPAPPALPEGEKPADEQASGGTDSTESADKSKDDQETKSRKKKRNARRGTDGVDLLPMPSFELSSSSLSTTVRNLVRAQVALKFAVAEHGDLRAIHGADLLSEQARAALKKEQGTAEESDLLVVARSSAETLNVESKRLREVAAGSLFGRFPLLRGFGLKTGDEEEFLVRSYSVQGEARRRAIANCFLQLAKAGSSDPLHAVILVPSAFVGEPVSEEWIADVDSLARQAFANFPNIKLYPGRLRDELPAAPAWDAPDEDFDPIARAFLKRVDPLEEPRTVMLIIARQFLDPARDGVWVQVQQRTYEGSTLKDAEDAPEDLEADKVRVHETLAHDRGRFNLPITLAILLLFAGAVTIPESVFHLGGRRPLAWQRWLAIPPAGFVIGIVLTPLTMMALERWLPVAETTVVRGAWWPCLAGALSLILAAGVFRLAAGSLGRYFPNLSCHGRWGISFVPVAAGVTAAWIQPACYALGVDCVLPLVALGAAASLLVYCFGRAIDTADQFPVAVVPIVIILALVFGGASFAGSQSILCLVAVLAAVTTGVHEYATRHRSESEGVEEGQPAGGFRRPRTIEQLRAALESPRYQPPAEFESLRRTILASGLTRARWTGLVGPTASGKTAAARHLISELQGARRDLRVLAGRCTEESVPYQPFREALAEMGVSARLLAAHGHGGDVNNIFERLADEFIPFWDFFSGYGDDDESGEVSRTELFAAVSNALHRLMEQQPLLIFIDDVQWIDDGSAALLAHLKETVGPGSEFPLTVMLASRDPEALRTLDEENDGMIVLDPPSAEEQRAILERSLGIERRSARHIVSALGVIGEEAGGMFWLMQALRQLVNEQAFLVTPGGFKLKSQVLEGGSMPVPAGMRCKLVDALRAADEHLPILECAALLGERFRVSDLAECLELDRLALLQILRHLEQDLQLVRDLESDEECFTFSSTFLLEIVRERLVVRTGSGGSAEAPNKIARELHGRIAAVLERRKLRGPRALFRIAEHSYAAGTAYASAAMEHCLNASAAARRKGDQAAAEMYFAMAEHSARRARLPLDAAEKRREIIEARVATRDAARRAEEQPATQSS